MLHIPDSKRAQVQSLIAEYKSHIEAVLDHEVFVTINMQSVSLKEEFVSTLICDHFGVEWKAIIKDVRTRNIAAARHMYCYIMYEYVGETLTQIGARLNRDHSTVLNSLRVIKGFIEVNDQNVMECLNPIINRLNNMRETEKV